MISVEEAKKREREAKIGAKNYNNWQMTATRWNAVLICGALAIGPVVGMIATLITVGAEVSNGADSGLEPQYWWLLGIVVIGIDLILVALLVAAFLDRPYANMYRHRQARRLP